MLRALSELVDECQQEADTTIFCKQPGEVTVGVCVLVFVCERRRGREKERLYPLWLFTIKLLCAQLHGSRGVSI